MYVIANENTLGYITGPENSPFATITVLAVKVEKGGDPLLLNNTTFIRKSETRQATDADFNYFGIIPPKNTFDILSEKEL